MILKKQYNKDISLNINNFNCQDCFIYKQCISNYIHSKITKFNKVFIKRKILQKGSIIFKEKDTVKYLYILCSGIIKNFFITKHGEEQIIKFNYIGDLFGLDGFNSGYYNSFSQVIDKSILCIIPLNIFKFLCDKIPSISSYIINIMSKEMKKNYQLIFLLSKRNAEKKIATFIYNLSQNFRMKGISTNKIKLSMSRNDIGNYLGLTIETISRILNKFKKNKILVIHGKYILINNYLKLLKLVHY
ncbi:helix-turn-helix domain-containing protein [Enterobacteriaceae endosymbiont of Neohaemonia nigricornis]|uniref:helix-turn-helix domain-containing protein n=1 Tax=Enterobacteriaceae endosymbiont of Neohaemonia nigricornis TaxID=2675792 RepID=UPI001449B446|nr:helix-turn-helix domain-containing protein [Enterobacteriaceae endosymbiont of Neohaemonia nigricornis]QJC30276.1 helix-turn-helix domain-containing protein [Enterobacteriaceae endosymbiont of Neohaemonia nigricornis]